MVEHYNDNWSLDTVNVKTSENAEPLCAIAMGFMIAYWIITTFLETWTSGYDYKNVTVLDTSLGRNTTRATDMLRS